MTERTTKAQEKLISLILGKQAHIVGFVMAQDEPSKIRNSPLGLLFIVELSSARNYVVLCID